MEDEKKIDTDQVETTSKVSNDDQYQTKGFWNSIKMFFVNLCKDTKASFIYNNMKLSAILVGIPGFFLGFFIKNHYNVLTHLIYPSEGDALANKYITAVFGDYSAMFFFFLMLIGFLNIFTAFSLSSKKNKGSVITAIILTVVMIALVSIYLFIIFQSVSYQGEVGQVVTTTTYMGDFVMVLISTLVSVVSSTVGCVFGLINYDRTYKKSDRK